jgi:serine/threonine protein kinase
MVDNVEITEEMIETIEELLKINNIKKISLSEIKVTKKIGEGGQAKVYRGTYEGSHVAVKILSEIDMKCLAHEIVILSNLNHPNIPKFFGIVLQDKLIGIVCELIYGKSLDEYQMKNIRKEDKIKILKSFGSALTYVHSINFIHRDLKPENILIENDTFNVFLIDFGIAKVITSADATKTRAKGTIHYLAPETFDISELTEEKEIISSITTKVDVWAFGCIISYLFSGSLPWCNKYKDNNVLIQKLLMKKEKFPVPVNIEDENIVKIVELATNVDFEKRASMSELQNIIENFH